MAPDPPPPESPPSPPSDNGDRLDREPDRPDESAPETTKPVPRKKRVMSEKQLENLRKGREARAERMKAKKAPVPEPVPEEDTRSASMASEPLEEEPLEEEEKVPEPTPKPKRKLSEKQLDALRRARESKASKAVPKKKPPTMTTKRVQTTVFEDLAVF